MTISPSAARIRLLMTVRGGGRFTSFYVVPAQRGVPEDPGDRRTLVSGTSK